MTNATIISVPFNRGSDTKRNVIEIVKVSDEMLGSNIENTRKSLENNNSPKTKTYSFSVSAYLPFQYSTDPYSAMMLSQEFVFDGNTI